MYLEAAIRVPLGEVLAVPKEAVIDSGLRRLVYVQTQKGHYAPQEVSLGRETDDDFEVLDGLMEDDVVAASGQFLIDSESRLRAIVKETSHVH
jgi:Cu(I)/Ag(I) efflux system membrane fusion protein